MDGIRQWLLTYTNPMVNNSSMETSIKTRGAELLGEWGAFERGRFADLASQIKVSPPVVSDWAAGKKRIPAEQCPKIEEHTGIRCEDLRPDVRWDVLRGTTQAAAPDSQPIAQGA